MENETGKEKWPAMMIDIETLGTGDDALILGIGAVCFDRTLRIRGPMFNAVIDPVSQSRRIEPETLCWWLEDEGRAAELRVFFSDDPFVPELLAAELRRLKGFISENMPPMGKREFWTKGDFDLRILEHAFKEEGVAVPWSFQEARELRTVLKWMGVESKHEPAHRALEDAAAQVGLLFEAEGGKALKH